MFGQKLIAQLGLDSREFHTGVEGATKMVGTLNGVLGQIGLGLGAGAVLGWFKSIIDKGGQLQDVSEQLGVTTDSLQAMEFAGKGAGVSSEQLQAVWAKLSVSAAEASDKTSSSAKALDKLGISTQSFLGLPLDRQLETIAKASANAADKNTAFAAVADLIGAKNAPRLNSVLQQLATEGFDGLTASARAAGQIIESDTIKRFDEIGDRVAILKTRLETFGSTLLTGVFNFAEGLGIAAAKAANMVDGIATDYSGLEESANKVTATIEKGNVALLGTKATTEDLKRLADARDKLTEKSLTDAEKTNHLLAKFAEKVNEASKYTKDTKEYTLAMTEAEGYRLKMADQRIAAEKKAGDDAKKTAEEMGTLAKKQREYDDEKLTNAQKMKALRELEEKLANGVAIFDEGSKVWIETSNRLLEVRNKIRDLEKTIMGDQVALAALLLIPEKDRTEVQKEQVKLLTEQTTKARQQSEILTLNGNLIAGTITPAERERLAVLIGQNAEADKHNEKLDKTLRTLGAIKTRIGKEYTDQSTESLEFVKGNLTKQLGPLENEKLIYGYAPGLAAVQSELNQLKAELNARSQFQNNLRVGDDFARRLYSPQEFARLSQAVGGPAPDQKRIADTLESIEDRLRPHFKK